MCRDGNLRIPSPTTGNTAQRAATIDNQHRIYSGYTFNKAFKVTGTQFKVKMTRLLPLNTIAAEAPITAKNGEYWGFWADILLARSES